MLKEKVKLEGFSIDLCFAESNYQCIKADDQNETWTIPYVHNKSKAISDSAVFEVFLCV